MSTEMSILLLWLVLIQEGAAIRPAVTFTPDYKKIFTSEQITMTCDVGSTIGEGMDYIWYRDSEEVYNGKSYIIQKAKTSHSGSYQCQSRPGEISDPARLDVSDGNDVILQTPLYIYEGDDIYIRCRHRPGNSGGRTRFDKDRINITDWSDNAEYYISNVTKMTAGTYRCIKEIYYNDIYNLHVDEVSVSVQDLFTTPTISVTPQPVITTDKMALTCQTSLPPPRHNTQLRIAFYREGGIVQGFGVSDTYEVYNVQLEDSGKYSCDVITTDGRVRKRSAERIIQIGEIFSHPIITVTNNVVTEGDPMTLTCDTTLSLYRPTTRLEFAFYRDGRKVQDSSPSNKYEVESAQLEDSGKYTCQVGTTDGRVRKRSAETIIQIGDLFTTPTLSVTPQPVITTDKMALTCQTSLPPPPRHNTQLRIAFYREGGIVQGFGVSDTYEVYNVQLEDSGKYSCEVETTDGRVRKRSAERIIQIGGEIFSHPIITVTNNVVTEGDPMALTCDTTLSPYRPATRLEFAFYRDGWKVQDSSPSNRYEVQSAQLEDSGNYTCHVRTMISSTMKISDRYNIWVDNSNELFSPPVLKVSPELVNDGDNMTLTSADNEPSPDVEVTYTVLNVTGRPQRCFTLGMMLNSLLVLWAIIHPNNLNGENIFTSILPVLAPECQSFLMFFLERSGLWKEVWRRKCERYREPLACLVNNPGTAPRGSTWWYSCSRVQGDFLDNSMKSCPKPKRFSTTEGPQRGGHYIECEPVEDMFHKGLKQFFIVHFLDQLPKDNEPDVVYALVNSKAKQKVKASQETSETSADIYQNTRSHR
ncbi:Fc receptor-like protein 5 [Leptodactylus fuscus]|uniref:Fc receptor-like protein 5 n=1 Tax=Leptodactylus fuscus TaxID=238119 RepID=UPI003F4EDC5D